MKKRLLSLVLCLVMVFSLFPSFAMAADNDAAQVAEPKNYADPGWKHEGGMATHKTLTAGEDGTYTINMEAYAQGEVVTHTLETGYPLDIVVVVDQSGSMASGTDLTETYNAEWWAGNLPTDQVAYYKSGDDYYSVYAKKGTYAEYPLYDLCYQDKSGTEHLLTDNNNYYWGDSNHTIVVRVFDGTLYVTSGTPRYEALRNAVTKFCQTVADKAEAYGVEHKIALVGFAGNESLNDLTPIPAADDHDSYHYSGDNRYYDYVNTGVFVGDQFINYKTITGYTELNQDSDYYINLHYYIDDDGDGVKTAIWYDQSQEQWYNVETDEAVTPSSGDNQGNPGYTADGDTRTYYEAIYQDLTPANYQAALVSASTGQNGTNTDGSPKGTVNSSLTQSIAKFGYLGGTYTSYGLAMANQVFANNTGMRPCCIKDENGNVVSTEDVTPKKVVIVFTDGQPGGSGFEPAIANEATADAARAKDNYSAQIYTVGMFSSAPSDDVENFMRDVSSEHYAATTNVSADDLDPTQTYYYTVSGENKSYAVSCPDQGLSLIKENSNSDGYSYSHFTLSKSGGTLTAKNASKTYYVFTKNGNNYTRVNDVSRKGTYYLSTSTSISSSSTPTEVFCDYFWENSDGRARRPLDSWNAPGNAGTDEHYQQYFTIESLPNDEHGQYYYNVQNAASLTEIFNSIAEEIQTPVAMTTLDSTNSLLRDVITGQFDVDTSSTGNVSLSIARGVYQGEGAEPAWTAVTNTNKTDAETAMLDALQSEWENGGKSLKVTGFDYGANYIANGKDGYKLIVTITGLMPNEAGKLYSNTDDSGIIEVEEGQSDVNVAPFTNPYITIDEEYKVLDFSAMSLLSDAAYNYNERSKIENGGSFNYESTAHNLFFTPAFAFGADGKADVSAFSETSSALYFSKAAEPAWKKVNVVPANNVYFDDDLLAQQNTLSRDDNGYGYLGDDLTVSVNNVTPVKKTDDVKTREITFHGKRLDVYFQSDNTVNNVSVTLQDAQGNSILGTINGNQNAARLDSVIVHKTADQTMVNVPVITVVFDSVNTYKVTLAAKTANGFRIDGVRVYGAADEADATVNTAYTADGEANASFTRVRELLLSAESFNSISDSSPVNGVLFVDLVDGTPTIQEYTKDGPKNEVYLDAGQGIAFNAQGYEGKNITVGLRSAESGTAANAEVSNGTGKTDYTAIKSIDMYYSVTPDANGNVYIKNADDSTGILAVTNIKVTDAAPTAGGESKEVKFFATAKTMSYVLGFDELETGTAEPSPEPTTEPTQQPTISDVIRQLISDFVASLFGSIGRLFGN